MFTKYGYSTISFTAITVFLIIAVAIFLKNDYIKYTVIVAATAFMLFTLYFFRDPERKPTKRKDVIVSPADGKILLIKEITGNSYVDGEAIQISVFMSPFDVHVNRIPIDGRVEYLNYVEGKFLAAFNDKADTENERNEIGILSSHGKVFYTQVAGAFARRIISELEIGDEVKIGERFGMIKFGSRSDIIVPKKWKPTVKVGEHVTAGETIIFELANEKN
jgi:phosphatidylserine decarboxylase